MAGGYIKLHRTILDWEWYDEPNTMRVFLHLLLTCNYEPHRWHGIEIPRGARLGSYKIIAEELQISERAVRTAIKHLEVTGEVTRSLHAKNTVFSINNFDKFQEVTSKVTSKRQGSDKQVTGCRQASDRHLKKDKKEKKEKNDKKERDNALAQKQDFESACKKYGKATLEDYLQRVETYQQSSGKVYADTLATACLWIERDIADKKLVIKNTTYDLDEYEKWAKTYTPKLSTQESKKGGE